jgi:hypothetical protein
MEEKKNINVVETAQNEPKKLSYEELEKIALNLQEQCQKLYAQNQEMQVGMMFKRLDYLFKVLKYYSLLETDFVRKCAKEIQELLTVDTSNNEE